MAEEVLNYAARCKTRLDEAIARENLMTSVRRWREIRRGELRDAISARQTLTTGIHRSLSRVHGSRSQMQVSDRPFPYKEPNKDPPAEKWPLEWPPRPFRARSPFAPGPLGRLRIAESLVLQAWISTPSYDLW